MRTMTFAAGAAFAVLLSIAPASAETVNYTAALNATSETPPNTSPAKGDLNATFDTATKTLGWTVTYSGLTGDATMAHFHGPAPVGKAAGVMVPVNGSLASPIKGSAVLTDEQVKALEGGQMYFNIHTAANKGGEIRGQVEKTM